MWPLAGRAQGGAGYPCPRLAVGRILAPASALPPSALRDGRWSPCGCGRAVGRVAPGLGGSSGLVCGVCRGWFLLSRFVPRCRRAARASSALGAVVASAGRFGAGRWGVSVAGAGVLAGILRCRGRGGLFLACRRVGFRWRLVGLGRLPAGRAAVRRPLRACVRRLRAGGRAAVASAVAASGAARSGRVGAGRVGGWGFPLGAAALPPPLAGVSVTAPVLPPAIQIAAGLSPA